MTESSFTILATILFVTLVVGACYSGEKEFPVGGRRFFAGLIGLAAVVFLTIRAIELNQFGDVLSTLASFLVAIVAVWHDQVVNLLNPPRAALTGPLPDPQIQYPQLNYSTELQTSQGHIQYHLEVRNLNRSRPLRNTRGIFKEYKLDGVLKQVAVPRQFTWAPHESSPKYAHIDSFQVLDFCYHCKFDHTMSLILYSGSGRYQMGERLFNFMKNDKVELHLVLGADNISDQHYWLTADLRGEEPIFSLTKFQLAGN